MQDLKGRQPAELLGEEHGRDAPAFIAGADMLMRPHRADDIVAGEILCRLVADLTRIEGRYVEDERTDREKHQESLLSS